jgi:perosamine synthetase
MRRRHGIAVANGSVALDSVLTALNLQPGDEVILPTFTIISCAAAIIRAGAIPVPVDCNAETWNMDAASVAARVTSRTRAIMVVHIYGLPVDLDEILAIAARHSLAVIEDAAEMHGQEYKGVPCGAFGLVSILSFYANKHVTTGEGGMILTNDDDLADRCRSLRNLCFRPAKRFFHEELGWNFRMSNLQAAVGVAQLERLDEFVKKKRAMGALYTRLLEGQPGLQLPIAATSYATNIYWVYSVVLGDEVKLTAAEVMARLAAEGVGTRPFFWPIHEQPALLKRGLFAGDRHPNSERAARRGFYLPSGLGLFDDEIEYSAHTLCKVLS